MAKFATARAKMPCGKGFVPCFEDEGKWDEREKALFTELNDLLGNSDELAESCARYLLVIMHHRQEQMLMLRAAREFKSAMQEAGFADSDILLVMRYAELTWRGGSDQATGWGPSVAA